ncbi:DUF4235 domain-containing protein [Bifidobacterium eulemuris]|uniref:DUF4235 domain-containing protein n=1 Tax=Bifidobacterium eulemuris TaxID=1765219 RepID=A0A261G2G1_9BIFI|nr:DUF4235 domain-containing protein [Bifidobacterium eulemuris]OZG65621.1 hypothetical protein BEUL_1919 [Bifidobacterium eulemuris]QOL32392.1 DUF4235 domain-containing protein [Bifidobacterium eulemuris]
MTDVYADYQDDYEGSSADRIVAQFHAIDDKVNAMRDQRLNDPDSLGDKLIKFALPTLAGLVAGKAFQLLWDRGPGRKGKTVDDAAQQGLVMSLAFAAASAAFGAIVSQLSDRGSQALVDRRHRKTRR